MADTTKAARPLANRFCSFVSGLCLGGRAHGTYTRAGTAGNAGVGIDHKLAIAFADGGNRTLLGASAARNTFITDNKSHFQYLRIIYGCIIHQPT